MNQAAEPLARPDTDQVVRAPFFIRGRLVDADEVRHVSRDLGVTFASPKLDLDQVVVRRTEPGPLFDVKLDEIIDFLVETGQRMDPRTNPYLQACAELTAATNPLPKRIIENLYRRPGRFLTREALRYQVEVNLGNPAFLDGWVERIDPLGQKSEVRAFPPRLVHMIAGNSPSGALTTIAQGALVKAVNVIKMPSSDPFTAVAILRTMADIDPDHPVVRSFSAVYWRGGDESVERVIYRPQYFDRIVGWGGGEAINNVVRYAGPGLQLISFDPKASISILGAEAFASEAAMDEAAELAAADITAFNQEACIASRYLFAEGDVERIDRFCEKLLGRLAVDREFASAKAPPPPLDIREEIKVLRMEEDDCRVWGVADGSGLVIRTPEPVDFHPTSKIANVVPVADIAEAVRHVNVATQTVGLYPHARNGEIRDALAGAGAQRIVKLGSALKNCLGSPHDAMYPLARFVHWIAVEHV